MKSLVLGGTAGPPKLKLAPQRVGKHLGLLTGPATAELERAITAQNSEIDRALPDRVVSPRLMVGGVR